MRERGEREREKILKERAREKKRIREKISKSNILREIRDNWELSRGI